MCVQIDDAGHQRKPAGVDDLGPVAADLANRGDAAIPDRDVRTDRVVPEPIDYRGAADHQIVRSHSSVPFERAAAVCRASAYTQIAGDRAVPRSGALRPVPEMGREEASSAARIHSNSLPGV